MRWLTITVILVACAGPAGAQEASRDEIARTIASGVDYLVSEQQPDGSWGPVGGKRDVEGGLPVAKAAMVTLALLHANLPQSAEATNRGFSWVTQHAPERCTYSAGAVMSMLFRHGHPERHDKLIDEYLYRLIVSQKTRGVQAGSWGYWLVAWGPRSRTRVEPLDWDAVSNRSDHSNMQFAVLALHYARRSGYQVPEKTWKRVLEYYTANQDQDGGWGYYGNPYRRSLGNPPGPSTPNMTIASTISVYLVEEALGSAGHHQCRAPETSRVYEAGVNWIAAHWNDRLSTYGWYAIERLGILTGRSNFGTHDWYEEGARDLIRRRTEWTVDQGDRVCSTALAVLFLARGLEPVIINKLQRTGDWNNDPYDVQHLVEHISHRFQKPVQWRIVTLEAPMSTLLRTPILYMNGHEGLVFTETEKTKLRDYVNRGGCLYGQACCDRKEFDASFRALAAELFPGSKFEALPKTHEVYTSPKRLVAKPALEVVQVGQDGRPAVLYSPHDLCCRWNNASARAETALDLGANITFYLRKHSPLGK